MPVGLFETERPARIARAGYLVTPLCGTLSITDPSVSIVNSVGHIASQKIEEGVDSEGVTLYVLAGGDLLRCKQGKHDGRL